MSYRKWGQVELDFIKDNFNVISDDEIAVRLSQITNSAITTPMVRRQRRKLGIQKPRGRQPKNKSSTVVQSFISSNDNN